MAGQRSKRIVSKKNTSKAERDVIELHARKLIPIIHYSSNSTTKQVVSEAGNDLSWSCPQRYDSAVQGRAKVILSKRKYTWSALLVIFSIENAEKVVGTYNRDWKDVTSEEFDDLIRDLYTEESDKLIKDSPDIIVTGWGWVAAPRLIEAEEWLEAEDEIVDNLLTFPVYDIVPNIKYETTSDESVCSINLKGGAYVRRI